MFLALHRRWDWADIFETTIAELLVSENPSSIQLLNLVMSFEPLGSCHTSVNIGL